MSSTQATALVGAVDRLTAAVVVLAGKQSTCACDHQAPVQAPVQASIPTTTQPLKRVPTTQPPKKAPTRLDQDLPPGTSGRIRHDAIIGALPWMGDKKLFAAVGFTVKLHCQGKELDEALGVACKWAGKEPDAVRAVVETAMAEAGIS